MSATLPALFTYPLRGQGGILLAVWVVVMYALLVLIDVSRVSFEAHVLASIAATIVGVFGFGVFQQYAWVTLRHFAAGHTGAVRMIETNDVLPLTNLLAAKVAMFIAALSTLLAWLYTVSPLLATLSAIAMGAVLPAMLGVMALEETFMPGLDVPRVAAFVASLRLAYAPFAAATYVGLVALYVACFVWSPSFLVVLVTSYAFVLGHAVAGLVLYRYHDRFDPDMALATEPHGDADEEATTTKRIEAMMVELHRLCAGDRVTRAAGLLETFLAERGFAHDERLHQRLQLFQDKRLMLEHSFAYMNRLLAAHKLPRAWLLLRRSLDVDSLFRPASADAVLSLVAVAPETDARYVDYLLRDFERAYPDSERLPEALFAHAHTLVRMPEGTETAIAHLERIEREFPDWAEAPEFRSFHARIRRHWQSRS